MYARNEMSMYAMGVAYNNQGQKQSPPPQGQQQSKNKPAPNAKDLAKKGRDLADLLDDEDMDDINDSVEQDPAQDYTLEQSGQ